MAQYEADRVVLDVDGKTPVTVVEYAPNGVDHRLQRRITELMDRIVQQEHKFTLAQLGYLHINTLMCDKETSTAQLRIYFDVHYAARAVKSQINGKKELRPVQELNVFEKYLFVGPLENAITFETIMAPKTKMVEDEMERASIKFKDDAKFVETEVVCLHCNLPITMAALHDISIMDPKFTVQGFTVGAGKKNVKKSIIASGAKSEVPMRLKVACSQEGWESTHYDPEEARTFLMALKEKNATAAKNQDKLAKKAVTKAEKLKDRGIVSKKSRQNFDALS